MTPDASYRAELLGTVQSGKAVPRIWRVFPQWAAISHARDFATDRKAALEISKQLRQTGQADVVPVAETLNDLLQGDAITKEQSAATLQRCLKMLWARLPSYTISPQDLARINKTYEGGAP
jgi:lipoate-protein ligase A